MASRHRKLSEDEAEVFEVNLSTTPEPMEGARSPTATREGSAAAAAAAEDTTADDSLLRDALPQGLDEEAVHTPPTYGRRRNSSGDGSSSGFVHELSNHRAVCRGWTPWVWGASAVAVLLVGVIVVVTVMRNSPSVAPRQPPASALPTCDSTGMWMLPKGLVPLQQYITLHPMLTSPYTFSGTTTVTVEADTPTNCIYMHSQELDIGMVIVNVDNGWQYTTNIGFDLNEDNTILAIPLPFKLPSESIVNITLSFSGTLNRNMEGLYLSTYPSQDGSTTMTMVATQFEATSARRAFPCFDEPALKAVFHMTVQGVPTGYTALSNMPESSSTVDPNHPSQRTVSFEPTVRMSSYLVALVVGKISAVSGVTAPAGAGGHSIKVRVWGRVGVETQMDFALQTAIKTLEYYQQFFGVPFPLPKCDLVAIPDFAAGAMENWGLVTFRETALLGNAQVSSQADLQRIAVVVCHELAHQWFGNLVTMEWWDLLWLNEGFATFMEFVGVQASQPQFDIWQQFLGDNQQVAMSVDALAYTHALSGRTVLTPPQIESQFDSISYSKGASVIFMVREFMEARSPRAFHDGIADYLQTYRFGNALAVQLWEKLGNALPNQASQTSLATRLYDYTNDRGVPVVSFTVDPNNAGRLLIGQERFFASEYSKNQAAALKPEPTYWWIPLTLTAEHEGAGPATNGVRAVAQSLFDSEGFMTASWDGYIDYDATRDGWIKANLNQTGYYRVNYPSSVWTRLGQAVTAQLSTTSKTGPFSPADRAGLIDDAFALAAASKMSAADVLTFAKFLSKERDYVVWRSALGHLYGLYSRLFPDGTPTAAETTCINNAAAFVRSLVTPVLADLGWNSTSTEEPLVTFLRSSMIHAATYFDDANAIAEAERRFDAWVANPDTPLLPAGLESSVFRSVVASRGTAGFDAVQNVYLNSKVATQKRRSLRALASATTTDLLDRALAFSLSSNVRSQDTTGLVDSVAYNPRGRVSAWNFVTTNWETFNSRYGSGGFAITSLVSAISGGFTTQSRMDTVRAFWDKTPVPAAELEIERGYESIAARIEWNTNQRTATCTWLANEAR